MVGAPDNVRGASYTLGKGGVYLMTPQEDAKTHEDHMIYVVSFHTEGSGGFEWFYYKEDAESYYQETVEKSGEFNTVRLVVVNVTQLLDNQIDYLEKDWPAEKEHQPA